MDDLEEGLVEVIPKPNLLLVEFKLEGESQEDQEPEDGAIANYDVNFNDPLAESRNEWTPGLIETNDPFGVVVKTESVINPESASEEENRENLPPPPPPVFHPTASKQKEPPAKKLFQSKRVKVLEDKEKVLIPQIRSVPYSERGCFICGSSTGRRKVPSSAIDDLYITNRILIPENARRCAEYHIENGLFTPYTKALIEVKATVPAKLAPQQFATILDRFADKLDPTILTPKKRRRRAEKETNPTN